MRAGLDVSLITFDLPEEELPGVRGYRLSRPFRIRPSTPHYIDYLMPAGRLTRLLKGLECDVLMGSYATHYGWLAARTRFRPFVLQTWTGDLTVYPFEGVKRFFFGPVVRSTVRRADLITTDGVALLDQGQRLFPQYAGKMIATRWGIQTDVGHEGLESSWASFASKHGIADIEGLCVVTAPRGLQHWYQPELLLPALMKALSDDEKLFVILLTLAHDRSDAVDQLVRRLEAHPRAHVVDEFITTAEMQAIWSVTDIVVSVPHSDGVSESVLESVYAGAFPILSDIPSNRSLVADGLSATLVPCEEPAIVEAIKRRAKQHADGASAEQEHNRSWIVTNATVEQTASFLAEKIRTLVA